jgi:aminopeptidase N
VTPRTRPLPALLGSVLAGTLVATMLGGPAAARLAPTPGSAGIGDPYFPLDGNGGIDVLHYDIRDGYRFTSGRLAGHTRLRVRATQDLSRFDLDFVLPVRSVTVDGRRARFRQPGSHELRITAATPIASGTEFTVSVSYAGRPATIASQGERSWLANAEEVVAMNEPHMAAWWFPANDHPRDKATYDIRITVPRDRDVIANGVLAGTRRRHGQTTYHWRATEPMATYLAFFAAGSFATRQTTCLGVPNLVAVSRSGDQQAPYRAAKHWNEETCRILTQLAQLLGPYPFSAMGGVVTSLPVTFALENQTRPTYPLASGVAPGLMAHELAHQWFGDSVSVYGWRDIWLNEGFATFMSDYLLELQGGTTMHDRLVKSYDALAGDAAFWNLSIDDPGPVRLFDGAVYSRGELALQALRQRIGDSAFWTLLRGWLAERRYGNGTVPEFEALAASVSGQDLTSFFDAWLHQRTVPAKTAENGF